MLHEAQQLRQAVGTVLDAVEKSKWFNKESVLTKDDLKSLARGGTRLAAETFILSNGIKGTVRILQSTERCLQSAETALGQSPDLIKKIHI